MATVGKQAIDLENNVKKLESNLSKENEVKDVLREVLYPLEHYSAPLETTWGLAKTLYFGNSTLMPTKSYLSINDRARRARHTKFTSEKIYTTLKSCKKDQLSEEEKRVVNKYLIEGKLNGLEIDSAKKMQLKEALTKLNKEQIEFKKKVDSAINQFKYVIEDYNSVREFPPSLLQATSINPTQPTKGPWKIPLQPFVINKFLGKYLLNFFFKIEFL